MNAFTILNGDPESPWIVHVPHSSTTIPRAIRQRILLDDDALDAELRAMTDAHTDQLARRIHDFVAGPRPWLFVNLLSRLVVDPERFPDEREIMNKSGMGAVYMRTSTGAVLRDQDDAQRGELIADFFEPYSRALADLVDERLDATGGAVILDVHSFPRDPLPYELFQHAERPVICLGTDERHTPAALRDAARGTLARLGPVAVNQPFGGSYVPLRHYRRDDRVSSIMLEIRRDAYLGDDGNPDTLALDEIATAAAGLIDNWQRTRPLPVGTVNDPTHDRARGFFSS